MKILDKYILRQFFQTFFFGLLALCIIFLVVDLLENLDDFIDNHAKFEVIFKYYIYFFPEILKILTPVAVLLSTLFTFGRLSNLNEITAMKTGGMSIYRILIPMIFVGIIISFAQLYFNGWVVPKANKEKFIIEAKYLQRSTEVTSVYNIYFRDAPLRNVSIQFYDAKTKSGNSINIEDYTDEKSPRLIKKIEGKKLEWDTLKNSWLLIDGYIRKFGDLKPDLEKFDSTHLKLNITHDEIVQLRRNPAEMNFEEFHSYIMILKQGGKDIRRQEIEYHGNYAFPFANLIVLLFGVPFASIRKKGGIAIQIGAAMIVSFLYMLFTQISKTIGYSMDLSPIITGWSANIIFLIAGIIVLIKTKT